MTEENNIKPAESGQKSGMVETYVDDMAQVLENDRGGLVKKIIHQEEKYEIEKINLSPESKRNQFFMIVGIILLFATLTILFFFLFKKDIDTIEIEKQFTPLIFNDKSDFIEIAGFKKEKITATVFKVANTAKLNLGEIEGFYLTENKKVVGFKRFIELLEGNFVLPGTEDGASFVSDNFLMGTVNNETKGFFILLKIRSIADVFGNMHAWENKMFSDLHGFFGANISKETSYLLTKNFESGIVENKNARILYEEDRGDGEKNIVLMYIFADDNSIVITNTYDAVRELILRLASSQIKK